MKEMKKHWHKIKNFCFIVLILFISSPVWTDLPKLPDKDLANSSKDWADVGVH